jgi:hypothetical protein
VDAGSGTLSRAAHDVLPALTMLLTMRAHRSSFDLYRPRGSMVAGTRPSPPSLTTHDACLAKARSNAASAAHGLLRVQRGVRGGRQETHRTGVVTAPFERQPAGKQHARVLILIHVWRRRRRHWFAAYSSAGALRSAYMYVCVF